MKFKFTPLERNWVLYDVGNSAFFIFATAVVPIYFNSLAAGDANGAELMTQWGLAQTLASLIVAIVMPILGSLADIKGNKIKFFIGFALTGIIATMAGALPLSAFAFLALYVVMTVGINSSLTFYDAMLVDVTDDERMDTVSSSGYAWGYIGSTIPFIISLALIFMGPSLLGISTTLCTQIAFIITGLWWAAFTIPLLKTYKQIHYKEDTTAVKEIATTLKGLVATIKDIFHNKTIFTFVIAYFCYIDVVHTMISMATSYGASLGIDSTQMVIALLVTQFVAFPATIIYGRLSNKFSTLTMIIVAVFAYLGITIFGALALKTATEFWILAVAVGCFQGGIQALSRSYFSKIIPKEHANEYFGFFDIFGKYAAVLGTFIISVVTMITGQQQLGVLSIAVLIVIALVLLFRLPKEARV